MSLVGRIRDYNRAYLPSDPGSLEMWFDAADSNKVTLSGSNVTTWIDKSGKSGNNATVPSGASSPLYSANQLNGYGIVRFQGNGGNEVLLVNNNLSYSSFNNLTYFMVIKPPTSQYTGTYAGVLSTDSAGVFGRSLGFRNGKYDQEYYSSFALLENYSNTWQIVSLEFSDTTSAKFTLNGTVSSTAVATGSGTNTTGFKIGSYNSSGGYATFSADFDAAEILVYSMTFNDTIRSRMEGYLAWKWGLVSLLPADHLYKSSPYYTANSM